MKIRFVNLRARIGHTLMRGYVLEIGSPRLAQSATNIDRFVGSWKEDESKAQLGSEAPVVPQVLRLERTDAGGLRVLYPSGQIANLTLSGQPVALTGPAVLTGTMVASKLMPDGSIEAMQTRNGKPVGHYVYTVSPDGRTMTDTVTRPDENGREPSVYVFVKQ